MDPVNAIDAVIVLTTLPADHHAPTFARALVDEGLAACVSVLPAITSIYRWQGAVSDDSETLAIIKTTVARRDALAERLVALHPYEVPELLELPVHGGHAPYLAWVAASVQ